jgi:S1-C subfamily serine protease
MPSMRTLVSFFGGAVATGLVVGALAVAGVISDNKDSGTVSTVAPVPTTSNGKPLPPAPATRATQIYKNVSPGVAFVESSSSGGGSSSGGLLGAQQQGSAATGSGFVYDNQGHIVTNDHVVEEASSFQVRIGANTKPIPAQLVGKDPSSDLAVLKVDPGAVQGGLKPLELGDSKALEPGDQTIAIGSPFGLEGTVTSGIVSSLGRTITAPNNYPIADAIQTDAAINPGNSGGPLLDGNGRVIGVNSQIKSGSDSNSGVGFAVPVSSVKFVVPQIMNGGKVTRAYLGVRNGDSPDLSGAIVGSVEPGGPAERSGLKAGDKITSIDGRPVQGSDDVSSAVAASKPGEKAKVTVERAGNRRTLTVDLGTRPDTPAGG